MLTEYDYNESFNESDDELLATTDFDGKCFIITLISIDSSFI